MYPPLRSLDYSSYRIIQGYTENAKENGTLNPKPILGLGSEAALPLSQEGLWTSKRLVLPEMGILLYGFRV